MPADDTRRIDRSRTLYNGSKTQQENYHKQDFKSKYTYDLNVKGMEAFDTSPIQSRTKDNANFFGTLEPNKTRSNYDVMNLLQARKSCPWNQIT